MRRLALLFCALGSICPVAAAAQQTDVRGAAPIADSLEIVALAQRLTARAATDSARAAALYEWVARNIVYDVAGYRSGRVPHAGAESVYRQRSAVCQGFVELYARLAREAGLITTPISGYAKGFDYVYGRSTKKPNHAWLAVRIRDEWRLVDPTWGAGNVVDGRFQPRFTWDFFLADPEVLLLSHFPTDKEWQLVARPLARADFERLPAVPRTLMQVGFTASAIRNAALQSRIATFPSVGVPPAAVRVVHAPLSGTIRRSATVPVHVAWPGALDVAVVSGDVWTPLARAGDVFRGEAIAEGRSLYVVGRTSQAQPYQTLLLYRVN